MIPLRRIDSEIIHFGRTNHQPDNAGSSEVVTALEAWVRRGLREYAVALRKLAYSLPNGVGERELPQLSEQMNTAASQDLGAIFASVGLKDPLVLEKRIE